MFNILKNISNELISSSEELNKEEYIEENDYNALFNKGVSYLNIFSYENNGNDKLLLHKAAISFTKAIELEKDKPESYFYMAYIFYFMKEFAFALKYLRVVSYLDPQFHALNELKNNILSARRDDSFEPVNNNVFKFQSNKINYFQNQKLAKSF